MQTLPIIVLYSLSTATLETMRNELHAVRTGNQNELDGQMAECIAQIGAEIDKRISAEKWADKRFGRGEFAKFGK